MDVSGGAENFFRIDEDNGDFLFPRSTNLENPAIARSVPRLP